MSRKKTRIMKLVASQQCSNKVVKLMLPYCKVWWGVNLELIYVHCLKPVHYISIYVYVTVIFHRPYH